MWAYTDYFFLITPNLALCKTKTQILNYFFFENGSNDFDNFAPETYSILYVNETYSTLAKRLGAGDI